MAEGKQYEIDLSKKHVDQLERSLEPFIEKGRSVRQRRGPAPSSSRNRESNAKVVRQWARDRGMDVNERGRVPAELLRQYEREAS